MQGIQPLLGMLMAEEAKTAIIWNPGIIKFGLLKTIQPNVLIVEGNGPREARERQGLGLDRLMGLGMTSGAWQFL